MDNDLENKIRERAYEIWQQQGYSGLPEDHWFAAEREFAGASGSDPAVRADPGKDSPRGSLMTSSNVSDTLPRPWKVVQHEESFEVQAANGQHIFFVYFAHGERRGVMKPLSEDHARRVANGIVKRINEE